MDDEIIEDTEKSACILIFKQPELSEWICYLFGTSPETGNGFIYRPIKGQEPNWFVRWMMKICFDSVWVKKYKD